MFAKCGGAGRIRLETAVAWNRAATLLRIWRQAAQAQEIAQGHAWRRLRYIKIVLQKRQLISVCERNVGMQTFM